MRPSTITRRSMLALLGAGAAAGIAAVVGRRFVADTDKQVNSASGDAVTPTDSSAAELTAATPIGRIGAAYLVLAPDEASTSRLVELVPELDGVAADVIEARLVELGPRITDDFATGETVVIDGWVLARTEARAAALVALAP